MTRAQIKKQVAQFNRQHQEEDYVSAKLTAKEILDEMHENKMFTEITEFATKKLKKQYDCYWRFEVAFAFGEINNDKEAKPIYEFLIEKSPGSYPVANNLAMIYLKDNELPRAWELIQAAYSKKPDNEVIAENYKNIKNKVEAVAQQDMHYRNSGEYLKREQLGY